jgi:hypothetical protein
MQGIYEAIVEAVYPPNAPENISKYNYEYRLLVTMDNYAQVPVLNAVMKDEFGSIDDRHDIVLAPGSRVLVMFLRGYITEAIIIGGIRGFKGKVDPALNVHVLRRFNRFQTGIDKTNSWFAVSDDGPFQRIEPNKIIIDDSQGQRITFDKISKTITVESELWNIDIRKDVTMTVGGNVTASIKGNANLSVDGDVTLTTKGNLKADIGKKADIKVQENANVKCKNLTAQAEGRASIKAQEINLNGSGGRVVTTLTDPVVDLITGVPSVGVPTVKSGGA